MNMRGWSDAGKEGDIRAPALTREAPNPHSRTDSSGDTRRHGRTVQLRHEGHDQDLPGRAQAHPQQHQPAILPRRQDRDHRAERLGQVDPDEDHGRPRQGIHRRGLAGREYPGRLSRAGAAARSDQDGQGERHGRGPPGRRHDGPLQRDLDADGRSARGRRFRRPDDRDGRAPGEDRRGRRLVARQPARDRHGRACAARRATPRSPTSPAARSAGSR